MKSGQNQSLLAATKLFVAVVTLAMLAVLLYSIVAKAANLGTRVEFQTALYERLEISSTDNFWDTTLVNRIVDKAVSDVQLYLQCERAEDTIALAAQTYRYSTPAGMAQDGVMFAFLQKGGSNFKRQVRPVPYNPPDMFGKNQYQRVEEFTIINDILLLNGTPANTDSLYVWFYKITDYMDLDTNTVGVPAGYGSFVLDLAYADCERIRGNLQFWQQETARIYALMREIRERFPKADPQVGAP